MSALAQSWSEAKYVATTAGLFPPVDRVKVQPVTLQPPDSATPPRIVLSTPELFAFTLVLCTCTLQLSVTVST